ncbi:alpha/beta hydrolase [Actinomadura barringtoniae]|uniref:Alpha/beta hydrolase n=1 Tax=Actinomadura barringtoniae TaxID=1427535 RepID=A0A939TD58_9ACTN|nr:alpha/beta hydrolase [Actinomadura barringtoniae]
MRFTAETSADGVIIERDFTLGEIPGVLWTPASETGRTPLILMGHGGGQDKKTPAQLARAREFVTRGFAVAAIDAPGHGDRPRSAEDEQARADLRHAWQTGAPIGEISSRYGASLALRAVPEWQATLDALQELPEIGTDGPVGYGGGITLGTAIGVPLTAADSRITAALFGGGFVVHGALVEAARRVTVPVRYLLQWDDEHVDRQSALAFFDAFGSKEKTMHANSGGHGDVPAFEVASSIRFFRRHFGLES